MKIDKAIFGVDNSYFLEFWPIQAKLVKEILGAEPILFYICDEESDFYDDGNGLVKKIKKVDEVTTGLLACIARMYGTKYFPEEVCLTCDLDMLMISREYFQDQIKNLNENSLVIYSSDAYDLNRPEAKSLFETEPFPFTQEMYNYPYNAAKGKIFDQILDTNCSFEEFVRRHSNYKPGYKYMWMIDEFYFADCVNNKPHNIEVHKLKRGYTTPWIANNRIERHNFPVELEWEGERQNQEKFGIYDTIKLKEGYYYDVNCCRPYSKYKDAIDDVIEIVLERYNSKKIKNDSFYNLGKKYNTDKVGYHRYDRFYPLFLESYRNKNFKLFEVGCGNDKASFNMWHEYFPLSSIYVMDISEEHKTERGIVFKGDQSKQKDLILAIEKVGKCEVIIDDGSHIPIHQINTFNELFPNMLEYGGTYIIEDIEASYWNPKEDLYGYQIGYENIIDYFSSYPHRINSEYCNLKNNFNISSITFAHNCIIIKKQTLEEIELTSREYRFKDRL
jgi:hypothetical protein